MHSNVPDLHDTDDHFDSLAAKFAGRFDGGRTDHRGRKPGGNAEQKSRRHLEELATIAADAGAADQGAVFQTSYRPSKHEAGWLLESLKTFYDQAQIGDVLALVRGGKEASVYLCTGGDAIDADLVAAKVYRPRQFRQLSNDAAYRQGREVLTEEGRPIKPRDDRTIRALGKKTAYGLQVAHTSWLTYEFSTLESLYRAGAAVPQPYAVAANAILMEYIGDSVGAAPILNSVRLRREEAERLYAETLRNLRLLLSQGWAHGDLSAYNILYWEGEITLIDFPQVTNLRNNPHAQEILYRDVIRVCEYFQRQGLAIIPQDVAEEMWFYYGQG